MAPTDWIVRPGMTPNPKQQRVLRGRTYSYVTPIDHSMALSNGVTTEPDDGEETKNPCSKSSTTPANQSTAAAMTGERTQEADNTIVTDDDDTTSGGVHGDTKQKNAKRPHEIESNETSESTADYFETFKGFLEGEKSAETVRKRLASPKEEEDKKANKSNATENGTSGKKIVSKFVPKRQILRSEATIQRFVPPPNSSLFNVTRSVLIDIPLFFIFACFVTSFIVKGVHHTFYEPLFYRALRTDEDLMDEFTYYERQCNEVDLTTRDMKDMIIEDDDIEEAVDVMLTHGLSVIPQVLQPDTVQALREYIVYRNNHIPEDEEYPMSNGYKRISYGIEATEHPAVIAALKEVANHPIVKPLLAALLGDNDPASSEITAITNYPGCRLQVWHQDTKQDGNAIKFARTYSHSYSLFLPLQNITGRMGATDVCPGTHYCLNDLETLCEKNSIGLNEIGSDHVFPAGAGALLNQHVWHRGGAHTDFDAQDRIVFIVSFLARPNFGVDPRQLSRGTYFHQKWNMWGHTWTDLIDPAKRMRFPFSVLRCLSLWKPFDSKWGYDLITSGFMRFANEQLEEEDFYDRFLPRLKQMHFPNFLRGRMVGGSQMKLWSTFIRSTIEKVNEFFSVVVLAAYMLYLVVGAGSNMLAGWPIRSWVPKSLTRLLVLNGLLAIVGFRIWFNIQNSTWGKHVSSGRALMRPFRPPDAATFAERAIVSKGPTTMPTRWDVLIGTRFSAEFLGSYRRWLDFHPGNVEFQAAVQDVSDSFEYFKNMESKVQARIVRWVVNEIHQNEGRFLIQDYITGDWRLLLDSEAFVEVAAVLMKATSPLISAIVSRLDVLIDDYRFGPTRGTAMGSLAHLLLYDVRKDLLYTLKNNQPVQKKEVKNWKSSPKTVASLQMTPRPRALTYPERRLSQTAFVPGSSDEDFQVGTLVWAFFAEEDGGWMPGSILDFNPTKEWYVFVGDDSQMDSTVYFRNLQRWKPLVEGDRIMGCFRHGLSDCYPGTITRVHPSAAVSVYFDDGEFEPLMSPANYYQRPFRYEGPFPA